MKKIFVILNPFTLGFNQLTITEDAEFVTNIISPSPEDVDRGLLLIEEANKMKLDLMAVPSSKAMAEFNIICEEIMPYIFCNEISDIYSDYITRRISYERLERFDPALHYILSHNKYRKKRIENVLNLGNYYVTGNTRSTLAQAKNLYDLDHPYKFQTASNDFKHEISILVTRIAFSILEEYLIKEKLLVM